MSDFKLSASLEGHEDDVRAVAFPHPSLVLSASRDKSVRLWRNLTVSPPSFDGTIISHGQDFVNSIAFVPPSSEYQDGLVVAGGRDAIIEVKQPTKLSSDSADALLLGHAGNVCALDVGDDGKTLVSGSWDTEARIWQAGRWDSSIALQGHTASVWAVCLYDKDTVLTGSADKHIHVYHPSGKLIRKLRPVPEVIRALCKLSTGHWSGAQFASAGNDGIIRLMTLEGHVLGELRGHESFIYSLALLPTGEIVSAGEDRTVRIWKDGQCAQVITHPAISVWSVAVCVENGDIVTGASDKIVRVFTRSKERQAAQTGLAAFEESVKASAIPQQSLGGINKTDLPGPEFLTSKSGTKEGQTQMIKESNGNVSAYQWSIAANQWVMIGTVVDASGGGSKTTYNGKEYDYVFDVDIKDGAPPLKLPYNTTQNPYEAAQKFIDDNELPQGYLDQVAQFIVTNSQGATIGQQQGPPLPGSDPWGQESRYRPGEAGQPSPAPPSSRPKVLPQTQYLSITTANLPMIQKKAQEFNTQLEADGQKDVTFNTNDLQILTTTIQQLDAISKNSGSDSALDLEGVKMILHMATQWPQDKRLPGLDLLRIATASDKFVEIMNPEDGTTIDVLAGAGNISADAPLNNAMMTIRALANLFMHSTGRTVLDDEFDKVHALVSPFITNLNRNMSVAITTLYINYSVLLTSAAPDFDTNRTITLLDDLTTILGSAVDAEALYRALVALGTLLNLGKDFRDVANEVMEFNKVIERVQNGKAGAEPRIKVVIKEMQDAMQNP